MQAARNAIVGLALLATAGCSEPVGPVQQLKELGVLQVVEYGGPYVIGDGDPAVVDSGTIEVDPDGAGTYFAVSDMYEDVVYDMTLVGDDVIYWGGEYDYYQKMA